jgi:hypothetical protein
MMGEMAWSGCVQSWQQLAREQKTRRVVSIAFHASFIEGSTPGTLLTNLQKTPETNMKSFLFFIQQTTNHCPVYRQSAPS